MAVISGATGSIGVVGVFEEIISDPTGTTPIAAIQKWQAILSNEFHDSAIFGSNTGGDTNYRGRHKISGSCEGFLYDNGDMASFEADFAPGASASTLTLTASTGRTYIFPAMINDWSVTVSVESGGPLSRVSFSFVSSGPITSIN